MTYEETMRVLKSIILPMLIIISLIITGCSSKSNIKPPTPLKPFNSKIKLKEIWQANTGNGNANKDIILQPIVNQGEVYTVSNNGVVASHNALTGVLNWQSLLRIKISASPAFCNNKIFIGSMNGILVALDASNGDKLWTINLSSSLQTPVTCDGDSIIISTHDGVIKKYNIETTKTQWSQKIVIPQLVLMGNSRPTIHNNIVYAGFANGELWAFDNITGNKIWDKSIATAGIGHSLNQLVDINSSPLVFNKQLVIGSYNGNLMSVNLSDEEINWETAISIDKNFTSDDLRLFVVSTSSELIAVDKLSGTRLWTQNLLKYRALSTPVVYDNMLITGDYSGYLHFFDVNSGDYLGRYRVSKSGISSSPVVYKDIVISQDNSGNIVAFKLS